MEVFEDFYKGKRPLGPILASLVEAAWLSHLPMVGATFVSGRTERCMGPEVTEGGRRHYPANFPAERYPTQSLFSWKPSSPKSNDSQLEAILTPRGHLLTSGDIFDDHNGSATSTQWVEAREAAGHSLVPRTGPTPKRKNTQ